MELPKKYLEEMQELLKDEFPAYLQSLQEEPVSGIRINTSKIDVDDFCENSPFELTQVPWCSNGFYVDPNQKISKHPYYYAGLYYIQEPSAMLPAALLNVQPGERVLDLCAAPGGKSTELGSRLGEHGFLVANDISNTRAKALLKNLELHGIPNVFVCSETPQKLEERYPEYFDAILVDAPCSGEGMFRREPSMVKDWEKRGPDYYAPLQSEILCSAVQMLKPGGRIVYSTCTFSKKEDEQVIEAMLLEYPEMECLEMKRLFPHQVKGEGHFAALLKKRTTEGKDHLDSTDRYEGSDHFHGAGGCSVTDRFDDPSDTGRKRRLPGRSRKAKAAKSSDTSKIQTLSLTDAVSMWELFAADTFSENPWKGSFFLLEDALYLLPDFQNKKEGIRYLRTGLLLGKITEHGFEPSQALAMALKSENVKSCVSFAPSDERVLRYLKGETVEIDQKESSRQKGWTLVCTENHPLGWAKNVNGTLRNKYAAGWRMR